MKKFLSIIIAVVMVLSSMAMVVSAEETLADGIYVNGVAQPSLSAAISAAGEDGVITISGTVEFGSRQGISTDLTLEGVNNATIIPSDSYGATQNSTNWKGLLNLAGDITVKNITFDGSKYGLLSNRLEADFVPVRCTSGNITLENVTILGSDRTLLNVGSSTTSATVTGKNLKCDAPVKVLNSSTYADVNVVNGTFYLESGEVNGLICTDSDYNTSTGAYNTGALGTPVANNHFTVECYWTTIDIGFIHLYDHADVTSTVQHFVATYENAKNLASRYGDDFLYTMTHEDNDGVLESMVTWAETNASSELKTKFGNLLLDAADYTTDTAGQTLLKGYASRLGVTEAE